MEVNRIECKIGKSKWLVIENGIIKERGLTIVEKRKSNVRDIITDVIVIGIVCCFSKELAGIMAVNSAVSKVVKLIV